LIEPIIKVVLVLSAVAMVALILLQHGRGADAGAAFGSGSSQSLFGARGSANFLSRMTSGLAILFFGACLALAFVYSERGRTRSVTEQPVSVQEAPAQEAPTAPAGDKPATPQEKSDVPVAPN